jgi:hypothetical protein
MSGIDGPVIARGRSCEVFPYGEGLVVKLSLPGVDPAFVDRELRDTETVHAAGATPMRTHGEVEIDGRRGIVLDRMDGIALTAIAERNPLRLGAVGRMLGAEHARVHSTRSDRLEDVREFAAGLVDTTPFAELTSDERDRLRAHLRALPAGDAVLHLDFHPQNVFRVGEEIVTIDWQSAAAGPPAADVAMTRYLFTEAELFPGISTVQRVVYGSLRRLMFRSYLAEYTARTGITTAEIDRWDLAARTLRLGLLDIASERDGLIAGIRRGLAGDAA